MLPVRIVSLNVATAIAKLERLTAGYELADDVIGRGDVSTWITAKVENDTGRPSEPGCECIRKLLRSAATELIDADIQDVIADCGRSHRGDVDLGSGDRHRKSCSAAEDRDSDL